MSNPLSAFLLPSSRCPLACFGTFILLLFATSFGTSVLSLFVLLLRYVHHLAIRDLLCQFHVNDVPCANRRESFADLLDIIREGEREQQQDAGMLGVQAVAGDDVRAFRINGA